MKTFIVIENGAIKRVDGELDEVIKVFGLYNVFDSRENALRVLESRENPIIIKPEQKMSDDERRKLENEQRKFGLSMMTDEERKWTTEIKKSIDQIQREFALMMMRRENANG